MPSNHPIFAEFSPFVGNVPNGFRSDFAGTLISERFHGESFLGSYFAGSTPPVDEEYFEWVDLLRSASEARGSFVFVELGAGYGRWAARAYMAAKQKKCTFHAALVEADPRHAEWAKEHMMTNGVTNAIVHECVVGDENASKTMFLVESAPTIQVSGEWYGQALSWVSGSDTKITERTYHGKNIFKAEGWGAIEVDVKPLSEILAPYPLVDLIDMDIQGAERELIESNIALLSRKVRRVHVGTHNQEAEARIRDAMNAAGWIQEWDFPCGTQKRTEYGEVDFSDGIQTWRNPRRFIVKRMVRRIGRQ